jgi:hypothetical protein
MIDLVTIEYGHRKEDTQVLLSSKRGSYNHRIRDYWSLVGMGRICEK